MEEKTRRLLLALELAALFTAAVLILVDYKLKRDLVDLFKRIEDATGQSIDPDDIGDSDPSRVRAGAVVGNHSGMEAPIDPFPVVPASETSAGTSRRTAAKRRTGIGDKPIPQPDQSVGT